MGLALKHKVGLHDLERRYFLSAVNNFLKINGLTGRVV